MAVYKVIQDIEAEDKLLGPLGLKGFVYAAIAAILIFIDVRLALSGAPALIKTVLIILFLPPAVLFGVLASPLGREQPTEVWLLSRIKFLIKNHERKWDQSGTKQLVTITVPKKAQLQLTKNLSQAEVSSRLQALASTLDSRGWAVKNAAINISPAATANDVQENDDRLAAAVTAAPAEPMTDVQLADDILDESNNPTAQKVKDLVDQAEVERKLAMQLKMDEARIAAEKAAAKPRSAPQKPQLTQNGVSAEAEKALLQKIHAEQNELVLHPPKIIKGATREVVMTPGPQTVKMELSNSGNDLSVATIARLANSISAGATVEPL